jgi:hypothetical protein
MSISRMVPRVGLRNETQRFSPKRRASLPDYLIGGNPHEFFGFEFAETTLCFFEPEPVDVSVCFRIEAGDEALSESCTLPARQL